MTPRRRLLVLAAILLGLAAFLFFRPARKVVPVAAPAPAAQSKIENQKSKILPLPAAAAAPDESPSPADTLNAPGGTIRRDLEILQETFATWQTNFPRTGNPVGENSEITAALLGDNRLRFALLRRGHPAVNRDGELCDRWGTPFRFHQLSGEQIEIRSAGPDRKFGTADDAFSPEAR